MLINKLLGLVETHLGTEIVIDSLFAAEVLVDVVVSKSNSMMLSLQDTIIVLNTINRLMEQYK